MRLVLALSLGDSTMARRGRRGIRIVSKTSSISTVRCLTKIRTWRTPKSTS